MRKRSDLESGVKMFEVSVEKALSRNLASYQRVRESRHRLKEQFIEELLNGSMRGAYRKVKGKLFFTKVCDRFQRMFQS